MSSDSGTQTPRSVDANIVASLSPSRLWWQTRHGAIATEITTALRASSWRQFGFRIATPIEGRVIGESLAYCHSDNAGIGLRVAG